MIFINLPYNKPLTCEHVYTTHENKIFKNDEEAYKVKKEKKSTLTQTADESENPHKHKRTLV